MDSTTELRIVTKVQDLASAELKRIGNTAGDVGRQVETVGRSSTQIAGLGRTSKEAALGFLMLAGNASGASNAVSGLVQGGLMAFMAGGPISAGLSVVGSLIGIIGRNSSEAAEKSAKLRQEQAQAAKEAKEAAEQKARSQESYNQKLRDELAILRAADPAEKQKVRNAIALREAREGGGAGGESLERERQRLTKIAEDEKRSNEERKKALEELDAYNKKLADAAAEQSKAYGDGLVSLRQQAEEHLRLSRLSAEQLKYERELSLIKKLRESGGAGNKERADSIEADVKKKMAADAAKEGDRKRKEAKEQASNAEEVMRHARQALEIAKQQTEEARKRKEREAELQELVEKNKNLSIDQLKELIRLTKEKYAADDAAAAAEESRRNTTTSDGSGSSDEKKSKGREIAGDGEGPLSQAREAKKRARRQRKNQRHLDNLNAEKRESMSYGTIEDGGEDPWAFDLGSIYEKYKPGKGSVRFKKPGGGVPDAPPPLADPVFPDGSGGQPSTGRGGGAGIPPAITPGDGAAQDNRGDEQAKNLAEAIKKHDEKMKAVADALESASNAAESETASIEKVATASDSLNEAVGKNTEKVGSFAEAVTTATTSNTTKLANLDSKLDTLIGQLQSAGVV